MVDIQRTSAPTTLLVTVGANVAGAEAIDNRFGSGVMMLIPAAFATAGSFEFHVGSTDTGTFYKWRPSSESETNPVVVAAGEATDMPSGLFGSKFIKIVNAAGAGEIYLDSKG